MNIEPAHVLITGAAGQIGYILSNWIAHGDLYGDRKVVLHLLDIPPAENRLRALEMELQDCAYPNLAGVIATTDIPTAYTNVDCAFLVASVPLKAGQPRSNLLLKNAPIFKASGEAFAKYAKPTVKVLVIGNPCNTNALVTAIAASDKSLGDKALTPDHFHSLSMLDHSRAVSYLASHVGVPVENVENVAVLGNHSDSMVAVLSNATYEKDGKTNYFKDTVSEEFSHETFPKYVLERGPIVAVTRGISSAASPVNASIRHMRAWIFGTDKPLSMGIPVPADNPYGLQPGVVCSFPCVVSKDGIVKIADFALDAWALSKLKASEEDLISEREAALDAVKKLQE